MNAQLIIVVIVAAVWFIRLEIKIYNLEIGKRYVLYDDGFPVSYLGSDGSLHYDIRGDNFMTYRKASRIKRLYPHLTMINKQTGVEVTE